MNPKFKVKISGIEKAVDALINKGATNLNLYDERFNQDSQCGGYHYFRCLCFSNKPLTDLNMAGLHVIIRHPARRIIEGIRLILKGEKEYDETEISK